MQGSKSSRPGPSYWKTAFLALFPEWAQEAYWNFIDTQRACRIIATPIKRATQVHLDKSTGGYRLLTMLEESLKAIEGPPSRRRAQQRAQLPIGTIYFDFNLAGELHIRATLEVLSLDIMVCEDALLPNRPLSRSPTDYEKFFNIIQIPVCEAVEQCMGLPGDASELVAEAFSDLIITIGHDGATLNPHPQQKHSPRFCLWS